MSARRKVFSKNQVPELKRHADAMSEELAALKPTIHLKGRLSVEVLAHALGYKSYGELCAKADKSTDHEPLRIFTHETASNVAGIYADEVDGVTYHLALASMVRVSRRLYIGESPHWPVRVLTDEAMMLLYPRQMKSLQETLGSFRNTIHSITRITRSPGVQAMLRISQQLAPIAALAKQMDAVTRPTRELVQGLRPVMQMGAQLTALVEPYRDLIEAGDEEGLRKALRLDRDEGPAQGS